MTKLLELYGLQIPLATHEVSPIIWNALHKRFYEGTEACLANFVVQPGDQIIELGCGLGIITAIMAAHPGVTIEAYDASSANVPLARRILAANGRRNVSVNQGLFVAGEPADLPFYVREDLWASSLFAEQGDYKQIVTVSTANLDEYLASNPRNLLVMDIEGGELELLTGVQLPSIERVFVELHDQLYGLAGVEQIFQAMSGIGFAYEPRGSCGDCVLFSRSRDPRADVPRRFSIQEITEYD